MQFLRRDLLVAGERDTGKIEMLAGLDVEVDFLLTLIEDSVAGGGAFR